MNPIQKLFVYIFYIHWKASQFADRLVMTTLFFPFMWMPKIRQQVESDNHLSLNPYIGDAEFNSRSLIGLGFMCGLMVLMFIVTKTAEKYMHVSLPYWVFFILFVIVAYALGRWLFMLENKGFRKYFFELEKRPNHIFGWLEAFGYHLFWIGLLFSLRYLARHLK